MIHSAFRTSIHEDERVRLELLYPPAMYYALVHNNVPIVRHLSIENLTNEDIAKVDVTVELFGPEGGLAEPWTRHIPLLEADRHIGWDDFQEFTPDVEAVKSTNESFPVTYRVTVQERGGVPRRLNAASQVLAHNEWLNAPALYESIAAFSQPNTKSVKHVLRTAGGLLEKKTGSSSIQGYQAGPERAALIGAAIYEAIRQQGITYVAMPASFEESGQKVRTTDEVLNDRIGNCIDLSVTYAACLEAAALHPLIWIVDGHAFAGFFLREDRLPETVSLEPNQMINIVEAQQALAVELTGVGPGSDSLDFADAVRAGRTHFRGAEALRGMVDVRLAHRSGLKPLPSADTDPLGTETKATPRPPQGQQLALPAELVAAGVFAEEENLELKAADDMAPMRIATWRKALLDLSLRNPLLKLPARGKGLDLHVPIGALSILDNLVHDGKAIKVVPQDSIGGVHQLQGIQRAQELDADALTAELEKDRRVYGAVTKAAYTQRMRGLQRDARTLAQETGSNYLYLTLGALIHPTPSGEARAPLFLLPVRIEGGAGNKPYTILVDGDEIAAPNHCLIQWLRVNHSVRIPELESPTTDESGIDIERSFTAIKKSLVDNQLSYRIDEFASLRLLQFSTFQMWRDLTDHWETFLANSVVKHLVENPGKPFSDPAGVTDPKIDETELHLPIAADGSQMRAITMAERGRSFVLEGPPGTGKSQTITNLIAHAISSGKKVLFVAEKQAALDVVKRRLAGVGLEKFCLDLHGRKQTVRSIQQQLNDALEHRASSDPHDWAPLAASYRARIATLQRYPNQLHTSNGAGFSAWSAYQAVLANGDGHSAEIPASFFAQPQDQRVAADHAARELPAAARSARLRPAHPWSISARRDVNGLDAGSVEQAASRLEEARLTFHLFPEPLRNRIAGLRVPTELGGSFECAQLASDGHLPDGRHTLATRAAGWDDIFTAARAMLVGFLQRHQRALATFHHNMFVHSNFDDFATLAAKADKGMLGKKSRRAELAEKLRPHTIIPLDETTVLQSFAAATAARREASEIASRVRSIPGLTLPVEWLPTHPNAVDVLDSTHRAAIISRDLHVRDPALWQTYHELGRALPAGELFRFSAAWFQWLELFDTKPADFSRWHGERAWTEAWDQDGPIWQNDLRSQGLLAPQRWGVVLTHTDALEKAQLGRYREQILTGQIPADEIEVAFLRGVANAALHERLRAEDLEFFDGGAHDHHVDDYLRLSGEIRRQLPGQLATRLIERRPSEDTRSRGRAGELIRRLSSRRDRLPFREALEEYPDTVTALTPCFLMSPASVANFLKPGAITFDIVVFDEASQIRVAQAVGAMGRARSVVVVGDSKQMPPTSVMEASHAEDTDAEDATVLEDLDSILAECVESGLPREWLSWHYRSTDESLISFSNSHYYEGKLASLPSPGGDPTTGITWHRVDGEFDRGARASRTNAIEARAIIEEVSRLLADPRTADLSIGIVTFNIQQRDLLLNLAEESTDGRIQAALTRQNGEELFVKNLENVQGDERDVILFSLAFSKNPETGVLPLNFGPLAQTGGERRLNVAITRARHQVVLFSSFDPKDIDLARTNALGTRHLRSYLELASGGVGRSGDIASAPAGRADRVTGEVAAAIRSRGYEVEVDFGLSHFTVDLVVRAPGADSWQVAVLLDGPAWGERPTVSDRDAAPELLHTLMRWPGVVRIWLPTWLRERDAILDRIESVITSIPSREPLELMEELSAPIETATAEITETPPMVIEPEQPTAAMPALRSLAMPPVRATALASSEIGIPFVPYSPTVIGTQADINNLPNDRKVQQLVRESFETVIAFEGPIEEERLARLVHNGFGFQRVTEHRKTLALGYLPPGVRRRRSTLGTFLWPDHLDPDDWSGFRVTQHSSERKFNEIAPEEIVNAMRQVFETDGAGSVDHLKRSTMELLGYRRRGGNIDHILLQALAFGVTGGRLPDRL
jgi:hypothetical protein